jgi:hypothetical protein
MKGLFVFQPGGIVFPTCRRVTVYDGLTARIAWNEDTVGFAGHGFNEQISKV